MILFIIVLIYIFWIVVNAFSRKPGMNTWHMFSELHMVDINLYDQITSKKFNVYTILPHTHLSMTMSEFLFLLEYIRKFTKLELSGSVSSYQGSEVKIYKIRGNRVLDI